ncbi:hypothetical protein Ssi03_62450 [Sphaerisporangium siamense]|uniref:DNA-binding protein n=1 Tax=Sphaerisporangium siamense TaxID=795645 RepID=A0A7W7D961_9ACTN|nr:hypothetical protein [Sphaerisporangium siamense]MBB4702555.1 hypothetical protein [Sphaerisporangium siamense]GII88255.1 hypothetical protein Ssi03_62450 [Sphaerisporangium siamense]
MTGDDAGAEPTRRLADPQAEWWTTEDVAAYLDVAQTTVWVYRQRGKKGDASGLPDEDELVVRTPRWRPNTIIVWAKNRPGRGTGGGRPRKDQPRAP